MEQRVTVSWLRACVTQGSLLPVKRETPLFRPLPHALPLPRFQGLVLAVSQYHREQREVLEELISRLGRCVKASWAINRPGFLGHVAEHSAAQGMLCFAVNFIITKVAYNIIGTPHDDIIFA